MLKLTIGESVTIIGKSASNFHIYNITGQYDTYIKINQVKSVPLVVYIYSGQGSNYNIVFRIIVKHVRLLQHLIIIYLICKSFSKECPFKINIIKK